MLHALLTDDHHDTTERVMIMRVSEWKRGRQREFQVLLLVVLPRLFLYPSLSSLADTKGYNLQNPLRALSIFMTAIGFQESERIGRERERKRGYSWWCQRADSVSVLRINQYQNFQTTPLLHVPMMSTDGLLLAHSGWTAFLKYITNTWRSGDDGGEYLVLSCNHKGN